MFKTIMVYGMVVILAIVMWYPGFMLARNMVRAVSEEEPSAGDTILAIFPGFNLAVGRRELYGSAKLVWIPMIVFCIFTALKMVFYFGFNSALGALISIIITYIYYVVLIVTWLTQSYVLFDMGTCTQASTLTKILAFVVPPLACWIIGRNCIPMMNAARADLEQEDANGEDYY